MNVNPIIGWRTLALQLLVKQRRVIQDIGIIVGNYHAKEGMQNSKISGSHHFKNERRFFAHIIMCPMPSSWKSTSITIFQEAGIIMSILSLQVFAPIKLCDSCAKHHKTLDTVDTPIFKYSSQCSMEKPYEIIIIVVFTFNNHDKSNQSVASDFYTIQGYCVSISLMMRLNSSQYI